MCSYFSLNKACVTTGWIYVRIQSINQSMKANKLSDRGMFNTFKNIKDRIRLRFMAAWVKEEEDASNQRERLFAVHGLSERTTVQTSSLLLRLLFFYLLANPTQPDPSR